ncbi:nitroreductase family protein [Notoacmeibacter ruber]|uniref:Putative NAD(P)H nitroreductase n=1 Tax=Notoacmeibacter ruber TaxID=2670375 RepID=A0A3L7JH17_9HYPH|nr:nitroreductase [Notoacmeibacter ruber]RLQ89459.1 nitroreductase [Notoacmeibacter ruber]
MTDQALQQHLSTRRSPPIASLGGEVPDGDIRSMLELASRVPDHGMLVPFRFILYRGDSRTVVGQRLADRLQERDGPLSDAARQKEEERFSRAPLVVGVVFVPKDNGPKPIPEWEQFLCSGAVAMNLLHAASALGYRANWITNWYSDDAEARTLLGLKPEERVAGFVHIGRTDINLPDRERPRVEDLMTDYSPDGKG